MQLLFVALTFLAVACLCGTIPVSLLSTPDMQITGNGSFNYNYIVVSGSQWRSITPGQGNQCSHFHLPHRHARLVSLARLRPAPLGQMGLGML